MKEVRKTFSAPMAGAIWRGLKGETRRIPQSLDEINLHPNEWLIDGWDGDQTLFRSQANSARNRVIEVKATSSQGVSRGNWEAAQIAREAMKGKR